VSSREAVLTLKHDKTKLQMSEKSGTNGNFNYFFIFIYRLKLKVKRLKMALTLDERVEIVVLSGRQGWCMLLKS
jgi:hypothetical protein